MKNVTHREMYLFDSYCQHLLNFFNKTAQIYLSVGSFFCKTAHTNHIKHKDVLNVHRKIWMLDYIFAVVPFQYAAAVFIYIYFFNVRRSKTRWIYFVRFCISTWRDINLLQVRGWIEPFPAHFINHISIVKHRKAL